MHQRRAWIFSAVAVVGIGSVVLFASNSTLTGPRFVLRVGVRTGVTAIAFIVAGAIAVGLR